MSARQVRANHKMTLMECQQACVDDAQCLGVNWYTDGCYKAISWYRPFRSPRATYYKLTRMCPAPATNSTNSSKRCSRWLFLYSMRHIKAALATFCRNIYIVYIFFNTFPVTLNLWRYSAYLRRFAGIISGSSWHSATDIKNRQMKRKRWQTPFGIKDISFFVELGVYLMSYEI